MWGKGGVLSFVCALGSGVALGGTLVWTVFGISVWYLGGALCFGAVKG